VTFQDGGNEFIGEMSLLKDGEALCWPEVNFCSHHAGYIDLFLSPIAETNVPTIHFQHEQNDLQCGTISSPTTCGNWINFGLDITWEIIFRIQDFHPGALSGRTKNVRITDLSSDLPFKDSHRFQIIGTNYMQDASITSPIRTSDPGDRLYADGRMDSFVDWIWDSNNDAILYRFPPRCMPNELPGPISHFMFNTFNIGNPTWDANSSTLSVTVSSPHLSVDGSLASGYYEMYFPNAVAKCLWGLSDSGAVKANILITDSDGTPNLATITQSQDQNGLTVIASNFHFSRPTINVKLTQTASSSTAETLPVVAPSPVSAAAPLVASAQTPTLQPVTQPQKKITITCIKNKMTKMVTGVKPVCPAGYKKK
jgi:hypothetical protein